MLVIAFAFILAGIVFIFAGIVFLSSKYSEKLSESSGAEKRKDVIRAGKICGYVSLGVGSLTICCGIFAVFLSDIFKYIALFYVICLIAAFSLISVSFKINQK